MDTIPEIKGYAVKNLIGRGGMATIYSGFRLKDKKRVAIKVILPELVENNKKAIDLFIKEAEFSANLSHPNLIQTYDLGTSENSYPYMIMELIKGVTIKDILREKEKLSEVDALFIISKVASALAYLHNIGIFHRDIKPSNIMIEKNTKRVLLTDFGIAAQSVDMLDHVATDKVPGTAIYMSPEQVRDDHLTDKTDIYSLGICLYIFLSGKAPFLNQDRLSIRRMHLTVPLPKLPKSFSHLDELLGRMCHKSPTERLDAIGLLEELHLMKKREQVAIDKKAMEEERKRLEKKANMTGVFKVIKGLIKKEK